MSHDLPKVTEDREETYLIVDVLTGELARLKGEKDYLKAQYSVKASHQGIGFRSCSFRSCPGNRMYHHHIKEPQSVAK
ncbi:hypothetical protein FRX31_012401, partial [Thalictrum thalictroides]